MLVQFQWDYTIWKALLIRPSTVPSQFHCYLMSETLCSDDLDSSYMGTVWNGQVMLQKAASSFPVSQE